MHKYEKRLIPLFMVIMLLLGGCGTNAQGNSQASNNEAVPEQQNTTVQDDWEIVVENEPTINIDEIPEYSGNAYITIANNIPDFSDSELKTESFETYSELDSLGRCGIAYANIGQDLMPIGFFRKMWYSVCKYRAGFDADRRQRFYWSG